MRLLGADQLMVMARLTLPVVAPSGSANTV
jgi:hypothetical protein